MADIPLNFRKMSVTLNSGATSTTFDFLEAGMAFSIPDTTLYVTNNGAMTTEVLQGTETEVTFSFKGKCVDDQLVSTIRPQVTGGTKDLKFVHGWTAGSTTTEFFKVSAEVSFNSEEESNYIDISGKAAGYKEGTDTYGGQSA